MSYFSYYIFFLLLTLHVKTILRKNNPSVLFGLSFNMIYYIITVLKGLPVYKKKDDTPLRVVYQGTLYLRCNTCCKRWFITFNGAECSGPLPIDAIVWMRKIDQDSHRPGVVEGYCENIHMGKICVGINIVNCPAYGNSDGNTGWKSVSRLIVGEVPRSQ